MLQTPPKQIIGVLLMGALLLSACQSATPTPRAAATATPRPATPTVPPATATPTAPAVAMPEVNITATEYAFDAPDQMTSGLVSVTLENKGKEPHHLQFLRLNDGVTLQQFSDAAKENPEAALPLVTLEGGPSIIEPGQSQKVILNLPAGHYLIACFVADDEDGLPHLAKGMLKPIEVIDPATPTVAQEPVADAIITMQDFRFALPEGLKAGNQVWKITNEGPQPHEMVLLKMETGKTMEDVVTFLQNPKEAGEPPFAYAGGMQGLPPDTSGWAVLDLQPGNYIALCFIPDPTTGKPHAELGMMQMFTIP